VIIYSPKKQATGISELGIQIPTAPPEQRIRQPNNLTTYHSLTVSNSVSVYPFFLKLLTNVYNCGIYMHMKQSTPLVRVETTKPKTRLNVPLINFYLSKGKTQAEIARLCNISAQAVSYYIDYHRDEIDFLRDNLRDNLLRDGAALIAHKAGKNLETILDNMVGKEKDLIALNAVSGTHIDKYRLLSGQSTANISYQDVCQQEREVGAEIEAIQRRLGILPQDTVDTQDIVVSQSCNSEEDNKAEPIDS